MIKAKANFSNIIAVGLNSGCVELLFLRCPRIMAFVEFGR